MSSDATSSYRTLFAHKWRNAALFEQLLSSDFDESQYVTDVLVSGNTLKELKQLNDAVKELNEEIRCQVTQHHSHLLDQTSNILAIETSLRSVSKDIQFLSGRIIRIRNRIVKPYQTLKRGVTELRNIQETSDILRQCLRITQLLSKLRTQITKSSDPRDLARAASSLSEIESILSSAGGSLKGIHVIDQHRKAIADYSDLIRRMGEKFLWTGLDSLNHSEVGGALQVFFNLGELSQAVDKAVKRVHSAILSSVQTMVSVGEQSTGTLASFGSGTSSSQVRASLWKQVSDFCRNFPTHVQQIWTLEHVLSAKVDPATHTNFFTACFGDRSQQQAKDAKTVGETERENLPTQKQKQQQPFSLLRKFWFNICVAIGSEFTTTAQESKFVNFVFVSQFAKLHDCFDEIFSRVQTNTSEAPQVAMEGGASSVGSVHGGSSSVVLGVYGDDMRKALMKTLRVFLAGYQKRTLTRLSEMVQNMFSSRQRIPPSITEVTRFINTIYEILEAVHESSLELQIVAADVVSKAAIQFANAVEGMIDTRKGVSLSTHRARDEGTSGNTDPQKQNSALFALIGHLDKGISSSQLNRTVPNLSPKALKVMSKAWATLRSMCNEILSMFVEAVLAEMASPLAAMHDEKFDIQAPSGSQHGSRYMQRFRYQVDYFLKHVLSLYQTPRTTLERRRDIQAHLEVLSAKLVNYFVRFASLLYPVSDHGKHKVLGDIAQLEDVLHALLPENMHENFAPYVTLRFFKEVIFTETPELQKYATGEGKVGLRKIDRLVLVHLLLSRHNSPKGSIPMPHAVLGFTLEKYSKKIDARVDVFEMLHEVATNLKAELELPKGSPEVVQAYFQKHYLALYIVEAVLS